MHNGRELKKADPSTIQDKLLVGYQGWFTCPGDGEPGKGCSLFLPSACSICLLTVLILLICFALPTSRSVDYESRIARRVGQLGEVIMGGSAGLITPYRMVGVRIQISGQTRQNTIARNSTRLRGSEPRVARNAICSLRGIRRL